MKIIVRMPNWIGDLVMASSILKDLRDHFKKDHITVMCLKKHISLLENNPYIDEVYGFCKPKYLFSKDILKNLKGYDKGILLTNSFSSAALFYFAKIKKIIGYGKDFRSIFLDKKLKKDNKKEHLSFFYKKILNKGFNIDITSNKPEIFLDEKIDAKKFLQEMNIKGKVVGINPLAAYGMAKCWIPSRFIETAKKLLEDKDIYILFFGEQKDYLFIKKMCMHLDFRAINLAGKTDIKMLVHLINECDVFLSNDSGPMHIASALGVKVVSLFGSTCPIQTGPLDKKGIICKGVSCSPCFQRECNKEFSCMKNIEIAEVVGKVKEFLC